MAHLAPLLKLRFTDENGDPLEGGKLWSYQAGTTTPLATFVDQSEVTANANPVILDANGEADVWIGSNAYKFVLLDENDVQLWSKDNVSSINNGSITASKLATDSVTTSKIADSAVTAAKIISGAVTAVKIATDAVTTAKIQDSAVTTAKINDGAVTQAKRASLGQQISGSSGNYSTLLGYIDVTNLSVSITTTGRPVFIGLIGDGSVNESYAYAQVDAFGSENLKLKFIRGSTDLTIQRLGLAASSGNIIYGPVSQFHHIDVPAAGTYTYKVQIKSTVGAGVGIYYAKLIAFEL